jgi:hypothetical protein
VVLRAVVVVALVAGAGLALQARQGLDWSELADPVRVRWARVIAGVLALAVLAAVARPLLRRLRRPRGPSPATGTEGPEGERMPAWMRVLAVVLVLLTLLLVWYVVDGVTGQEPRVVEGLDQGPPPDEGSESGTTTEGPSWPTLLMIAAVLAAVALLSRRRTLLRLTGGSDPTVAAETTVETDAADLSSAVTAAEVELARPGDARAAIVAAYAAMAARLASDLARRGRPASAADTPTELLDRAAGSGLVDGAAAGTLTQLFREARFSRHPMGEPERRAAEQALAQVRDELGARRA